MMELLQQFDNEEINLEILAEECAEVIQIKSKIVRFGMYFRHPETGRTTRDDLVQELGDVLAMIDILEYHGMFGHEELFDAKLRKLEKLKDWY